MNVEFNNNQHVRTNYQTWELMGYGRRGAIHWWSLLHFSNNWVKYIFIVRCYFNDFIFYYGLGKWQDYVNYHE
jgi:hypothetical protein